MLPRTLVPPIAPRALPTHRVTGGGKRARTADPLLAKQALFQLSYTPALPANSKSRAEAHRRMVGLGRVELPTSRLSGVRSDQLSYRPVVHTQRRRTACRWPEACRELVERSVVPMFAQN